MVRLFFLLLKIPWSVKTDLEKKISLPIFISPEIVVFNEIHTYSKSIEN